MLTHLCQRCGNDFPVQHGDTDAFCDDCAQAAYDESPEVLGVIGSTPGFEPGSSGSSPGGPVGYIYEIALDSIYVQPGFNSRDQENITPATTFDLAESIRENGLLEPIVVQPIADAEVKVDEYGYRLICGERRLSAYKFHRLGDKIPAYIRCGLDPDAARALNLIENIERKDLTLLEEAKAIRKNWPDRSTKWIAQKLGHTARWVQVRLALLEAPEKVQQDVMSGLLSQDDMLTIIKVPEEDQAIVQRELISARFEKRDPIHRGRKLRKRVKSKKHLTAMAGLVLEQHHEHAKSVASALVWAAGEIDLDELLRRLGLEDDGRFDE